MELGASNTMQKQNAKGYNGKQKVHFEFSAKKQLATLDHPVFLPDLTPCDLNFSRNANCKERMLIFLFLICKEMRS